MPLPFSLFNQFAQPNDGITGLLGGGVTDGYALPGYGGGMFGRNGRRLPEPPIIDETADVEAALAENAAKPRKRGLFGGLLGGLDPYRLAAAQAMINGDSATAANIMSASQEPQRLAMKRQQEMEDWVAKQKWERANPKTDTPGIADEVSWYQNLPPEQKKAAESYMKLRYPGQFVPPAPVVMEPGDTISGMGGGSGGAPPVGTIQGGMRFKGGNHRDPSNWEPAGGPSQNSSGGFPGSY